MAKDREQELAKIVTHAVAWMYQGYTAGEATDAVLRVAIWTAMAGMKMSEPEAKLYIRDKITEGLH